LDCGCSSEDDSLADEFEDELPDELLLEEPLFDELERGFVTTTGRSLVPTTTTSSTGSAMSSSETFLRDSFTPSTVTTS
jgi:hypothetical protein